MEFDFFKFTLEHGYPVFWFPGFWRHDINAVLPQGLRMAVLDSKCFQRKDFYSMHPQVEPCIILDDNLSESISGQIKDGMPVVPEDFFESYGLVYWSAWLELFRCICDEIDPGMVADFRFWWGADGDIEGALRSLAEPENCDFLVLESSGFLSEIICRIRPQNINELCHVLFWQHRLPNFESHDDDGIKWLWKNLKKEQPLSSCSIDHHFVAKNLEETGGLLLYQDQFYSLVNNVTGWGTDQIHDFYRACMFKNYEVYEPWHDHFLASASPIMDVAIAEKLFDFLFMDAETLFLREPFIGQALLLCCIAKMKLQYPDIFQKALKDTKKGGGFNCCQ